MKTVFSFISVPAILLSIGMITVVSAQTPDTIPPSTPNTISAPPPEPSVPSEPKAEKEKKDGFNSRTRLGIRVGALMSKQDFESSSVTEDPESKLGADLAVLVAIPIGSGFFMLQPELHWLQKGYKIEDSATAGDITSTLNYIELPLLLRVNFGGSLRLFGFAGPSAGYLISGSYEDDLGEQDPTDFLNELEFSGHVGLGVGLGTFEVDLRYIAGLSDIAESVTISEVKNSSFGAGITLKF